MSTRLRSLQAMPSLLLTGGCLTGGVWAVAIALAARGITPFVLVLPALASLAVAFGAGLLIGGRGLEAVRAAAEARRVSAESQHRIALARHAKATRQIGQLLAHIAPGAALFGPDGRLVAWTVGFADLADVPRDAMAVGHAIPDIVRAQPLEPGHRLPLDELLSGQAGSGTRQRLKDCKVEDSWAPMPDGSLLITCRPASETMPIPAL